MPYQRVGAAKISDHHVRSPLLDVSRACQTCHRWPEDELRVRVEAQRKCQFFIDFVEAENSSGFHAPQESMRVLAAAIDTCRQGQLEARGLLP